MTDDGALALFAGLLAAAPLVGAAIAYVRHKFTTRKDTRHP